MIERPILNKFPNVSPISIHPYNHYLPTAFNESMSILQKINKVIQQLNSISEISNELVSQWNELMAWIVGNGLTDIVSEEIDKRIEDGTFDTLIYRIVGDLSLLETENKDDMVQALNEVFQIASTNDTEIGDLTQLQTTLKDNLVNVINELKERVDVNLQAPISIAESTGYGIISGFKVTQQQVLAMAVEVGDYVTPNILHLPNGIRYTLNSLALPVKPSHATLGRKDIIYVNNIGVVSYLDGTLSVNPIAPNLPDGAVLLAEITVNPTDTTVNDIDIEDKRQMKSLTQLSTVNKSNLVQAINEVFVLITQTIGDGATKEDLGDKSDLKTSDKSNVVNAINEVIDESATKTDVGDKNNLPTTDKSNVVNAIIEIVNTLNDVINDAVGDVNNLPTTDKTNIVNAIIEVVTESATKIDLGDKNNLPTTDKSNVVNAIIEIVDSLNDVINNAVGDVNNLPTIDKTTVVNSIIEIVDNMGDKTTLKTVDKSSLVNAINEIFDKTTSDVGNALDEINAKIDEITLNVKNYGAKGDGNTDDTTSIINTVSLGGNIYIPKGTYMIDVVRGIYVPSNTTITLHPQAILKAIPTAEQEHAIFWILNVENVTIKGGKLIGEKDAHIGTSGEYGHGIIIQASKNIIIEDLESNNFWGDGIFVDASVDGLTRSKNISLISVLTDRNRRQGFSICGVDGLYMENCKGTNTGVGGGTAPQSGIDFEPHYPGVVNDNMTLESCEFTGNLGPQLLVASFTDRQTKNLRVNNCTFDAKTVGVYSVFVSGLYKGNNIFDSCVFKGEVRNLVNVTVQNSEMFLDETHLVENSFAVTMMDNSKMINNKIYVKGLRKFLYASPFTDNELLRIFIEKCVFYYDGNANPVNTAMNLVSGKVTFDQTFFMHTGVNPLSPYIVGVDAVETNGINVIVYNTYVDPIFKGYYGWEGYLNFLPIKVGGKRYVMPTIMDTQNNSVGDTLATLTTDFNSLLTKLKSSGIMK